MDIQSSVQSLSVPSVSFLTINGGLLALLIILVLFSAFFSMTETVFTSVSEAKIKNYVEERKTGAKKALFCVEAFSFIYKEGIKFFLTESNLRLGCV